MTLTCQTCGAEGHLCELIEDRIAQLSRAAYEAGARIGVSAAFCYDPARSPDIDATVESIMRRYDEERAR